jgi:hypothetical protein
MATGLVMPAMPASALEPGRQSLPVVGGTALQMRGGYCTAGFVVQADGFLRNLSAYRRATRYVVTSKHCGPVGTEVSVGGVSIGKVTWTSSISDLSLIEVLPSTTRTPHCSAPSTGISCTFVLSYTPRAVGRVLLTSFQTRGQASVPVTGFRDGAAEGASGFCTSGATTGVECLWSAQALGTGQVSYAGEHGAVTTGTVLRPGDSGCPVVTLGGVLYGVHSSAFRLFGPNLITYISAGQFFSERPGYSLAPS